ncbi:hypothetical protein [Gracilimonas mengyeensis]|uniref:Uncharacterized protein n=1 Tax=Gracilimonas mengyeensis TaxID=1302730 RepID=A0A521C4P8_9BACT|nr:hypothetical protein [Gracilimonas mengyeensis]SMO54374.1 hypothetical protein SAMN06265219_104159 [Gracilimonas mengyeensis]
MHYPIFNSIVNTVETQLGKRKVKTTKFRTWEDNKIHATGLELLIDLQNNSEFMDSLSINFDWDSFRETSMAKELDGMKNHPFLKIEALTKSSVTPTIDVEMSWLFDIEQCQPEIPGQTGNYRIEKASQWMEAISNQVNELLAEDDIITRWHIEIDGDKNGRYLSAINLISYFQYNLSEPRSLNEVQQLVSRRLHELLRKANKVISVSNSILEESIAA